MTKRKSPTRGDLTNGSPWALISIFPVAFQRKLGHSPSDRGRQALRYRSTAIVAYCSFMSIGITVVGVAHFFGEGSNIEGKR